MNANTIEDQAVSIHNRLSSEGCVGRRWRLADLMDHATMREIAVLVEYGAAKYLPQLDVRAPVRIIVFF